MPISIDATTKIISITTPTTEVTIQELVDDIRDWEDELANLNYPKVIDAVGKADLGGGVSTGIVMSLSSLWQVQFWGGSGYTSVKGGTMVGGVASQPVKATGTAGDLTIQIQPTDAVITTSSGGGGGATPAEIDAELSARHGSGRWNKTGGGGIMTMPPRAPVKSIDQDKLDDIIKALHELTTTIGQVKAEVKEVKESVDEQDEVLASTMSADELEDKVMS